MSVVSVPKDATEQTLPQHSSQAIAWNPFALVSNHHHVFTIF